MVIKKKNRDFASCFGEHAVRVSDCSGGGASSTAAAVPTSVSSTYKTRSSTHKELLINVTWSNTHIGPTASIGIGTSSQVLREKRGRRPIPSAESEVVVSWDFSAAKYGPGPEPILGFNLAVLVDGELALSLGDVEGPEFSMVGRRERIVGCAHYSTRARFSDDGKDHEVGVAIGDELSVWVDKKRVVQARNLEYNFRGNQTVFLDGSPVDLMWDLNGWWFGGPTGCAVILFRVRSTLESRLWLEEMMEKEQGGSGFSLVIQAFKSPVGMA